MLKTEEEADQIHADVSGVKDMAVTTTTLWFQYMNFTVFSGDRLARAREDEAFNCDHLSATSHRCTHTASSVAFVVVSNTLRTRSRQSEPKQTVRVE